MCIINITKTFTCGESFDKKILFFLGSVLDRIRLLSRSATINSKITALSKNTFQNISVKFM